MTPPITTDPDSLRARLVGSLVSAADYARTVRDGSLCETMSREALDAFLGMSWHLGRATAICEWLTAELQGE